MLRVLQFGIVESICSNIR